MKIQLSNLIREGTGMVQGHGPGFGPTKIRHEKVHAASDPITPANRTEFINAIAAKHGEGFVSFAREALNKGDLLACDAELKKIGFTP